MKTRLVKISAFIMAVMLVLSLCACGENKTEGTKEPVYTATPSAAVPTIEPGDDLTLEIKAPGKYEEGENVEFVVDLTNCGAKEGLLGIDYTVEYDKTMFEYVKTEQKKAPSTTWETWSRNEKNTVIVTAVDDSEKDLTPITAGGQYQAVITLKVIKNSTDGEFAVRLYDVAGTINNDKVEMAYGKGNTIAF